MSAHFMCEVFGRQKAKMIFFIVHRALQYHFHLLIRSNVQNESNSLHKGGTYLTVRRHDAWDWECEGSMAAANRGSPVFEHKDPTERKYSNL